MLSKKFQLSLQCETLLPLTLRQTMICVIDISTTMKRIILLSSIIFIFCFYALAQTAEVVVSGVVKDDKRNRALANVNIRVVGSNVGTVTNDDGVFVLKVADIEKGLVASHVSYDNVFVSAEQVRQAGGKITIRMEEAAIGLTAFGIYGGDPRKLVEEAIDKIPDNYAPADHMFSAFYRETIQKRRRYVEITEAFLDVLKTDYAARTIYGDKVRLHKGRRLVSQRQKDTLAIRISGGPMLSVYQDVVKNGDEILSQEMLRCYKFSMEMSTVIDNRMQYVVRFTPNMVLDYALYEGLLYIDQETLSVTRAELEMDMSDKGKAINSILRKKPFGLRFNPLSVTFVIGYKQQGGRSYLNYICNEIRFKCDWKKRLFSSTYTVKNEMVMVDRTDNPAEDIKSRETFKNMQILSDMVNAYWEPDFWNEYNIIEPEESLESGIEKLKGRIAER